jgi:hypothetical protein
MSSGTKYRETRQFCQQVFSFHAKTIKLLVIFDSNDYRYSLNATPACTAEVKAEVKMDPSCATARGIRLCPELFIWIGYGNANVDRAFLEYWQIANGKVFPGPSIFLTSRMPALDGWRGERMGVFSWKAICRWPCLRMFWLWLWPSWLS